MHMHFKNEADKKAHEQVLKKTTVFLGQVASLLRAKRFASWYASNESRFDWAGERLFSKLRKDLIFQVKQAVSLNSEATDIELLHALADLIERVVSSVEAQNAVKNTKKEKSFAIPRDADASELIFQFLSRGDTKGLIRDLPDGFYVWNAISSLVTFARARETLVRSTGNTTFEKVLSGLNEDYLVGGYPHDLLAFDAHDVRTGIALKALLMRIDYCSTMSVKQDEELVPSSECRTIHFKNAA